MGVTQKTKVKNSCPQRAGNSFFMAVTYSKPCFSEGPIESHQPKHHHLYHQVLLLSISQFFGFVKVFLKGVILDTPPKTNLEPQKLVSL